MIIRRGKGKVQNTLTLKDAYKEYKKDNEGKGLYDVDAKTYKGVNRLFNELVIKNHVIQEGEVFNMPHLMGQLFIRKKKLSATNRDSLRIDWKTTKELGKVVYHLNPHTSGFNYSFRWTRRVSSRVKNITKYAFIPTRIHKRYLASLLKDPESGIDFFTR